MEFADGKGPKQQKLQWATGQFITIYGNGNQTYNTVTSIGPNNAVSGTQTTVNASSVVNPASVAYPDVTVGSGSGLIWSQVPNSTPGKPGSFNPGLVLQSGVGNNTSDVSYLFAPAPYTGIQDIESTVANVAVDSAVTWSGTSTITIQGTIDRFNGQKVYSSGNWTNIVSGTVASGAPLALSVLNQGRNATISGVLFNSYRLTASGGSGLLTWTVAGMFLDMSAMAPTYPGPLSVQPNLGQLNITDPRVKTLTSGLANSQGTLNQSNQGNLDTGPGIINAANNSNYIGQ